MSKKIVELPTFRASRIAPIMSQPRAKKDRDKLTSGGQREVIKQWLNDNYGIRREFSGKETKKGHLMEEDAITRVSVLDDVLYKKNEERIVLPDSHLSGEADIVDREHNKVIDVKCPWDAETFMVADLSKEYEYQGRAYMYLYGCLSFDLVYVLTDCPESVYDDEYRRYCWNNNIMDDHLPEYKEQLDAFRRTLKFSENPAIAQKDRVKRYTIKRDFEIEKFMLERLKIAADFYGQLTLNHLP